MSEEQKWIEERAETCEAYESYLASWSNWNNPWETTEQEGEGQTT